MQKQQLIRVFIGLVLIAVAVMGAVRLRQSQQFLDTAKREVAP